MATNKESQELLIRLLVINHELLTGHRPKGMKAAIVVAVEIMIGNAISPIPFFGCIHPIHTFIFHKTIHIFDHHTIIHKHTLVP